MRLLRCAALLRQALAFAKAAAKAGTALAAALGAHGRHALVQFTQPLKRATTWMTTVTVLLMTITLAAQAQLLTA